MSNGLCTIVTDFSLESQIRMQMGRQKTPTLFIYTEYLNSSDVIYHRYPSIDHHFQKKMKQRFINSIILILLLLLYSLLHTDVEGYI